MSRARLLWTILGLAAAGAAFTGLVDAPSRSYADAALSRALLTFAVARTLDGAISFAQGTEVAVEPAGVGVNFALGQVLDPINDLVERFSFAMLVAASSLGLQNVLLAMSTWWGTTLALGVAVAFALLALWHPRLLGGAAATLAVRMLLICVFLRFAVPVFIIGSNLVFDVFLAADQQAANQALSTTSREIEEWNAESVPPLAADASLWDRLGRVVDDASRALDLGERMEQLKGRVASAVEHIVDLIVIFALQTIILPLVFLWLFAELLKTLAVRVTKL